MKIVEHFGEWAHTQKTMHKHNMHSLETTYVAL